MYKSRANVCEEMLYDRVIRWQSLQADTSAVQHLKAYLQASESALLQDTCEGSSDSFSIKGPTRVVPLYRVDCNSRHQSTLGLQNASPPDVAGSSQAES